MPNEQPTEETFLRVFLRSEDDLRAYARALLPTWEVVDEVMQEASLVMWRKLDQLRDESEFLPWAKVIVRFESLKARRTFARDRHQFGDDVFELLAAEDESNDEEVWQRERLAMTSCLGKFEPAQRDLVLLPYRGHGAVVELATDSGKTVNSLYKKIGRLREKLTVCIEHEMARSGANRELL
ncbi:MAG: sigma factor [Verrucomicrobiales bacterium]|nr:sigma factor [Verrucomicrobiales bacterium]